MLNSYEPTFIYLQEEDAIKAGATDMKMTLAAVEKRLHGRKLHRLTAGNLHGRAVAAPDGQHDACQTYP